MQEIFSSKHLVKTATLTDSDATQDSLLKHGFSNHFKLVILGAEGAGKTSSINTLLNLPFQPNQESTVGASVNKCTVDMHYATSKPLPSGKR